MSFHFADDFFHCAKPLSLIRSHNLLFSKTQQWPQDCKRSVFIPLPKKGNAKECSNYHTIALISHASKAMVKIHQARLQQYVNSELSDVQAGFRKGRRTRDQIANICWIIEKAREFQKKHLLLPHWLQPRLWLCGPQQTVENSSRNENTRLPYLLLEKSVCRLKKQQLELNMEQRTGSKSEKEYVKAVYCHSVCLTYMQSTSWETLGWRKHKLESRLPGEISITSICRWHHPYGRKWRGTKEPLDESERGEWKKLA